MKKIFKIILVCITFGCILGACACSNKNTVNVTVEQLIEANNRQSIVSEYGNLHITETSNYKSGSTFKANAYFYSNDYGMVMDYLDEDTNSNEYYSTTLIDGVMFAKYKHSQNEWYNASVFADSLYDDYINNLFNLDKSEVIKGPEIVDGKIVVETECQSYNPTLLEKKTFYFNPETLLIERMTAKNIMNFSDGTSDESNVEAIYEYGCSDFTPKMTAYNEHKNAENKSSIIIVRNVGTSNEKHTLYTIANESELYPRGTHEIYSDVDCTIKVENYKDYAKEGYVPVFYLS